MSRSFCRLIIALLASGFIGLGGFGFNLPDSIQVWAATDGPEREQPGKTNRTRTSRVSMTPTLGLLTIRNLRSAVSPGFTRLVLDLDRRTRAPKTPPPQTESVVIEIPNARLSKSAQDKLARGKLAQPFVIAQMSNGSVSVSLPPGTFLTYKLTSLENPPRLVVDVVPANQTMPSSVIETTGQPSPSFEAPPQPLPPRVKSFRTIVIDPGHGGRDPGAHGVRGTDEKDVTLRVALKLRDFLSREPGLRVLMTRERDVFVELEDRARFANSNEADLFVSIHVNSHPQHSVRGIEIYHFGEAKDQRALEVAARENGTPLSSTGVGWEYLVADLLATKKIEASLELAWNTKESMITHLNGHYTLVDHGVKTAPFYVLRFTSMPSILAEIAYISNQAEEDLLRTNGFLTRVAESLHEGVRSYLVASKSLR